MHNPGPGRIGVELDYNGPIVLLPADTHIATVEGTIGIAIVGDKPATFEFEFIPVPK